jgi:regulator of sirC expression with transglutaminase-like and TPR domain
MNAQSQPDETSTAFAELMRQRDDALPLDRAALLLAHGIAYHDLDPVPALAQLDRLASDLRDHLPAGRAPRAVAEALRDFLGGECHFRGPTERHGEDYYDPRNSFLNDVLGRRIGLPIALSAIYLEVARRLEFPLAGVGMPFHFLVKYSAGGALADDLFLDPFYGGALLTADQLRERFDRQAQGRTPFAEHYLGAVTKKQLLSRMLLNLKGVYLNHNDLPHALTTVGYQLLIAPWDLESRRDHGLLALRMGDTHQALADLEAYERFAASDPNLPMIRGYIEVLRRRVALERD